MNSIIKKIISPNNTNNTVWRMDFCWDSNQELLSFQQYPNLSNFVSYSLSQNK
jgi:hypothetical protein